MIVTYEAIWRSCDKFLSRQNQVSPIRRRRSRPTNVEIASKFKQEVLTSVNQCILQLGFRILDDEAYDCLLNYPWPGNVRELRNAIESALLTARDGITTVNDLPPEIGAPTAAASSGSVQALCDPPSPPVPRVRSLEMAEAESIRFAIKQCHGNLTQVAAQLGIAKSTLYEKIKKYQLRHELGTRRSGRSV